MLTCLLINLLKVSSFDDNRLYFWQSQEKEQMGDLAKVMSWPYGLVMCAYCNQTAVYSGTSKPSV